MNYLIIRIGKIVLLSFLLLGFTGSFAIAQTTGVPLDPTNTDKAALPKSELRAEKVAPIEKNYTTRIPLIALAGQRLLSYLTNLRSAIEHGKGIPETEKSKILLTLNQDISYIQTEVVTVSNARTQNDLDNRIAKIKTYWQNKQNTITYYLGLLTGSGIARTIEHFRTIETKFNALFSRFEPTSDLLKLKEQFSAEVDLAETNYTKARDIFSNIKNPGDHKEEFTAGIAAFREAHTHLKEARVISRKLVSQLHEVVGTRAPEETSTPTIQP